MVACKNGCSELVHLLLSKQASVNICDIEGKTALMIACHAGNERIVEHLCHLGAELNMQDNKGRTAIMRSCELESPECMKLLLKTGAQIDIEDDDGKTVLTMVDGTKKQILSEYATSKQIHTKARTTFMTFCENNKYESIKCIDWEDNREYLNLQDCMGR